MKKHLVSLLVLFLMVSSSLVGVSNQTSEMSNNEDISNEPLNIKCVVSAASKSQ